MLDPEGRDVMEKQKESNPKEGGGGGEVSVPASNLQDQRQASDGNQSPRPISRAETLSLLRGQSTNRSWVRRNSAKWGPEMNPSRLSMFWSSTRRKGLKELLLQSSQASPTWLTPSPKETLSTAESQRGVEDPFSEVNSEEPCLALDPLEHEWMLTVAQGDAESILNLLAKEPSLLSRRDFVTGFTVLHWLAKHGRHEDLIEVMSFAERNGCPTNVNVLTASGRMTPLHLAALQGHVMTVKILVGAFGANTNLRDHNGRKAWQYLHANAPRELKELLGATEEDLAISGAGNTNNNCAPSRWGWMIGAFRTEYASAEAPGPGQRSSPMGSYFRNIFRQAVAFFQDH
ncbi:ankyrin repeat domain-containing protein SOWAHD [Pseudonaja textilis]|uniref:ankyrin repeat domain-containing protein SOWAHD n=1 Tax=Pseudonaja textilis TaxID=8673 RepID=UPI000EAAC23F|nr:ankyrin repeat domain-containing protein SOWAHD [Pseudonaja textilis]XP_026558683.1 ankyrin repeat domain-containing protein SOWAHD [Pseudonaja textilis]XP_026558684.1 ankyrin repeat domain-containing protein SOWAHD [Pseudonaja textilis]XP_026558685.1 ankyrin repeat domain-containing protein SOWAHD [Pseudonaja textilis]XP_026558686.1 ankyrin repeat domain-containing protein SOWAHD [Pseudonaja textilis]